MFDFVVKFFLVFCLGASNISIASEISSMHSTNVSSTQKITAQAFRDAFIEEVKKELPEYQHIELIDDETIKLKNDDKNLYEARVYLGNAYAKYHQNDLTLSEAFAGHIRSIKDLNKEEPRDDKSIILPVIKDAVYYENVLSMSKRSNLKNKANDAKDVDEQSPIYAQKLNDDLYLFYALNYENSMSFLSHKDLKKLSLTEEQLKKTSLENLDVYFAEVGLTVEKVALSSGHIYVVSADENFETSALLLPKFINKLSEILPKGFEPVYFLPARGWLFIADKNDADTLQKAKKIASDTFATESYAITPYGYVMDNSNIIRMQ